MGTAFTGENGNRRKVTWILGGVAPCRKGILLEVHCQSLAISLVSKQFSTVQYSSVQYGTV